MSRKSKGINAERELVHLFWKTGEWTAIRVAGSGSIKYPAPDIVAGNRLRKLAIECKVTGDAKKYMSKEDIEQIKTYADLFGAEAWIAVKLERGGSWHFLTLEDLDETQKGFVISTELAMMKGLLFEEVVQ